MAVGRTVWKPQEEVKLSKLLLTFWQHHGSLPHVRAYGFWMAVKGRLTRFTSKQIQRKVFSLRRRHRKILTGNIDRKLMRPHEVETLSLWVKMIRSAGDDDQQDDEGKSTPAVIPGRESTAGEDAGITEQKESTHIANTDDILKADADERLAIARQQAATQDEAMGGEHESGYGMGDVERWGGAEIRGSSEEPEGFEKVDSSCCIIEETDDPEEVEEVEEEEAEDRMEEEQEVEEEEDDKEGEPAQQAEQAASDMAGTAYHDPTQDNHKAFQHEEAPPLHSKQELQMLTRITTADLASAVRTLADIVARARPIPM